MERRTALKNIGLSFGALVLTPTVAGLVQSCQTAETGWMPEYLTAEEATLAEKIAEVILPTTPDIPGATDLNLIQFMDKYLLTVSSAEEREAFRMSLDVFSSLTQKAVAKDSVEDLSLDDIDQQLNKYLRATDEEKSSRQEAFNAYMTALEEGADAMPPLDGIAHVFLHNFRGLAVFAFKSNVIIGEEVMAYVPVPGQQKGCVSVEEATGGRAYSL